MIITILIYAIAVMALLQPNAPRLYAALVFVAFMLAHEWLFSHYDGLAYYGSAALFDIAIMGGISGIRPMPKLVITIHKVCIFSIIANMGGFAMWALEMTPSLYNAAFIVIYAITLLALLKRDKTDDRGFTMDSWRSCFRYDFHPGLSHRSKGKETL
jgi:hypothetical protein